MARLSVIVVPRIKSRSNMCWHALPTVLSSRLMSKLPQKKAHRWPKDILKKCPTSLTIRIHIKMSYHFTPCVRLAHITKNKTTKISMNVEKMGPSFTAGGIIKWSNFFGKQYRHSSKTLGIECPLHSNSNFVHRLKNPPQIKFMQKTYLSSYIHWNNS